MVESGGIRREGLCQETLIPFLLNIDFDDEASVIRSFGYTFVELKLVISSSMEYQLVLSYVQVALLVGSAFPEWKYPSIDGIGSSLYESTVTEWKIFTEWKYLH